MATAWRGLVTFFPERPERSLPRFISCIAAATFLLALALYPRGDFLTAGARDARFFGEDGAGAVFLRAAGVRAVFRFVRVRGARERAASVLAFMRSSRELAAATLLTTLLVAQLVPLR